MYACHVELFTAFSGHFYSIFKQTTGTGTRLKRDSQKRFGDATRDATGSAMDACDANSRNTIHRRSQRCDKVMLIWIRYHDIRAVWYNLYKFLGNS